MVIVDLRAAEGNDVRADQSSRIAPHFITVDEFAEMARVSRRTINRYRKARPSGFPTEYDIGRGAIPRPRFKLVDVRKWLDSRALW